MIEELDPRPLLPADVFEAPDFIEPVAAYRKWRVVDGRLRSLYAQRFWFEPLQRAECHADGVRPHMAPHSGCTCGIYASHEPDCEFPTVDYRGVSGIVTVWGDIEVHADGIRAEWAQVEALAVYDRWSHRQIGAVREVARELGADLIDLHDLGDAAAIYGRRLDPRLIPADR